jgi:hypothetical protein
MQLDQSGALSAIGCGADLIGLMIDVRPTWPASSPLMDETVHNNRRCDIHTCECLYDPLLTLGEVIPGRWDRGKVHSGRLRLTSSSSLTMLVAAMNPVLAECDYRVGIECDILAGWLTRRSQ